MVCIGTAGTVTEMLDLVEADCPDVVLTDVWLRGIDGIEGTRRLLQRWPEVAVVAFSGDADDEIMARAQAAGVTTFVVLPGGWPSTCAPSWWPTHFVWPSAPAGRRPG